MYKKRFHDVAVAHDVTVDMTCCLAINRSSGVLVGLHVGYASVRYR